MNRRLRLMVCTALGACALGARAECEVNHAPASVHIGTLGTFEASGAEMTARLTERAAQIGITCPRGAVYHLRIRPARDGLLSGDVVSMVHADGGRPIAMAVVLESFEGARVQRRFSALPQAQYTAVGTGLPQWVLLRLEPVDSDGYKRTGRGERTAPGFYRVALKLEVELQ